MNDLEVRLCAECSSPLPSLALATRTLCPACSRSAAKSSRNVPHSKSTTWKNCLTCETLFYPKKGREKSAKFCSTKCRVAADRARKGDPRGTARPPNARQRLRAAVIDRYGPRCILCSKSFDAAHVKVYDIGKAGKIEQCVVCCSVCTYEWIPPYWKRERIPVKHGQKRKKGEKKWEWVRVAGRKTWVSRHHLAHYPIVIDELQRRAEERSEEVSEPLLQVA